MEGVQFCYAKGIPNKKYTGEFKQEVMEEKILALYACGMSQRDISEQINNLYDVEISAELVTNMNLNDPLVNWIPTKLAFKNYSVAFIMLNYAKYSFNSNK